ncbi:MAG TPA: serine protease [Chloroflexia bacterium]
MPKTTNRSSRDSGSENTEGGFVEGLMPGTRSPGAATSARASITEVDEVDPRDDEPVANSSSNESLVVEMAEAEMGGTPRGELEDVPGYAPSVSFESTSASRSLYRVGGSSHGDTIEASVPFGGQSISVDVPFLDAWYAQYASPTERAVALRASATSLLRDHARSNAGSPMFAVGPESAATPDVFEVVIQADDRVQINNTKVVPWQWICSLLITAGDGSGWIGTGWLIGPRTVITAGHCVYMREHGGWVREIRVMPGRNGSDTSLGNAAATEFRSVRGWVEGQKRVCDYGAIILPESSQFGRQLGTFGYAMPGDGELAGLLVNISGYPGDKPPGTQWYDSRTLASITPRTLVYDADTAGGQSGAPVWWRQGGKRYVVGIHTNGATSGNSATRIVEAVHRNLTTWRDEGA